MSALIIGSGNSIDKNIFKQEKVDADYIICADGGLEKADELNLLPDVIIGDFDSVNPDVLKKYMDMNIRTMKFPKEKDYTDMELAIEYALKMGFCNLTLIGASGSRLDHTFANAMLLEKYYERSIFITMLDNNNKIQILKHDMEIRNKKNYFVSIVPIINSLEGLTLQGFKYPLDNVNVEIGSTLCISNQIVSEKGIIRLVKGTALLFTSRD
jgi:thiamine pyrophosphokinase